MLLDPMVQHIYQQHNVVQASAGHGVCGGNRNMTGSNLM
jgi:hypothetical protein